MKKMKLVITILVAALALYQGTAFAQLVSGKVVSTDATAKSITISKANAETGANEDVTVWVNDETAYTGVDSLAGLATGNEVLVEAEEDAASKNWMAMSVQRLEAEALLAETAEVPAATETTTATQ